MAQRFRSPLSLKALEEQQVETLERFLDAYRDSPPLTLYMLGAMVAFHLGATFWDVTHQKMSWWKILLGQHTNSTLLLFGARSAGKVAQGEYWRLLTSGFVHGDVIHLGVNGLALVGLGRMGEAVFGPVRFLWIFLLSVLGGALLAQMTGSPLSFGASGGLFGLMGAMIAFGWIRQQFLPAKLVKIFGTQLAAWTVLNLLVGLLLPFVSSSSHVGGLIAGLVTGFFVSDRLTREQIPNEMPLLLGSGALLSLSFGCLILW